MYAADVTETDELHTSTRLADAGSPLDQLPDSDHSPAPPSHHTVPTGGGDGEGGGGTGQRGPMHRAPCT